MVVDFSSETIEVRMEGMQCFLGAERKQLLILNPVANENIFQE